MTVGPSPNSRRRKKIPIPKAIREQVWIETFGENFKHKCYIKWCKNEINVFSFHVGHDKPESKGGSLSPSNLRPICSRCNLSMSNVYSISQWNNLDTNSQSSSQKWKCCF